MDLSQARLSALTGLPQSRITELIKGRRGITMDSAIRLARVLGPHTSFWMSLQNQYDEEQAQLEKGQEYAALQRYKPALNEAA